MEKDEYPSSITLEFLVYAHSDIYEQKTTSISKWFVEFLEWISGPGIEKPIKFYRSTYNSKPTTCRVNITDPGNPSANVAEYWQKKDKFQKICRKDALRSIEDIFR